MAYIQNGLLCNLVFNNYIYESFQCRVQVNIMYIDFQKAFDSVNHKVLIHILKDLVLANHYCFGLNPFLVTDINGLEFLLLSLIYF